MVLAMTWMTTETDLTLRLPRQGPFVLSPAQPQALDALHDTTLCLYCNMMRIFPVTINWYSLKWCEEAQALCPRSPIVSQEADA
jgi:hypothetical protein